MPAAVVDTTVLFAAANKRDESHDAGLSILRGIDDGTLPEGVVTEYVLAETMNGLTRDVSPAAAVDFLERLTANPNFSITRLSTESFEAGKSLFRRYDRLSLVDGFIVSWMRQNSGSYLYSFDDDFDGLDGVTRLAVPRDPFGV